ncbi:MAG: hypothetical protein ACRC28_14700 [Clostridium sp.]|uniref:hypothetical protein n=1 Tax=Clostridium sp. TaxID=1506 RepID=UPI003F2A9E2E
MKRITLKIFIETHADLKAIADYESITVADLLREKIEDTISEYILNKELEVEPISKDEAYENIDKADLMTVSFELDKRIHRYLKDVCKAEKCKLKHLMRALIEELVD